jgi:hypothetical protein
MLLYNPQTTTMDIYYNFMSIGEFCINVDLLETVGSLKSKLIDVHGKCNICILSEEEECYDDVKISSVNITCESIIFRQKCADCKYAEDAVRNRHLDCLKLCNLETSQHYGCPYCTKCEIHKCECEYIECQCMIPYCECTRDIICPMNNDCDGCHVCYNDSSRLGLVAFELGDYIMLEYICISLGPSISGIIEYWNIITFPDDDKLLECVKILSKYEKYTNYGMYVKMMQEGKFNTLKYLLTLQPDEFMRERSYTCIESSDPFIEIVVLIVQRCDKTISRKFLEFVRDEIPILMVKMDEVIKNVSK